MKLITENQIARIEAFVTKYLTEHESGTVETMYDADVDFVPFFMFKDVVFNMFKRLELRRRLFKHDFTEYRLTSRFPEFGRSYLPKKPRISDVAHRTANPKLSNVEACRLSSKVYQMDLLLRKAKGTE